MTYKYLTVFIFSFLFILEFFLNRFGQKTITQKRWLFHLALAAFTYFFLKITFLDQGIRYSSFISQYKIGLFNNLQLNSSFEYLISLLILDFALYLQHRFFHVNKYFWKLHKLHHTDVVFDVTTAIRFHPIEIIISMIYKYIIIAIFGIKGPLFLVYEIYLNSFALFNHSSIFIPQKIENFLNYFIMTPDMHRIHHSTELAETNSNYGNSILIWDKLFKSIHYKKFDEQKNIKIGL